MTAIARAMTVPGLRFGAGSSNGLCRTCMASMDDGSDMAHHLLIVVFTDESHAVEPVVLQHVHHAHEVAIEHVLVGADEDPLLLRIPLLAEVLAEVVPKARKVGAEVLDEDVPARLD